MAAIYALNKSLPYSWGKEITESLSPWMHNESYPRQLGLMRIQDKWIQASLEDNQIQEFVNGLPQIKIKKDEKALKIVQVQSLDASVITSKKTIPTARSKGNAHKKNKSKKKKNVNSDRYNRKRPTIPNKSICKKNENPNQILQSGQTDCEKLQIPSNCTVQSNNFSNQADPFIAFIENQSFLKDKSSQIYNQNLKQLDINIISSLFLQSNCLSNPNRQKFQNSAKVVGKRQGNFSRVKSRNKQNQVKKSEGKVQIIRQNSLFILRKSDGLEKQKENNIKWKTGIWKAPFHRQTKKPLNINLVGISCPKNCLQYSKRIKNPQKILY